jgi:hypothetical protein
MLIYLITKIAVFAFGARWSKYFAEVSKVLALSIIRIMGGHL